MPEAYDYLKVIASLVLVLIFIYAIYYYLFNYTPALKGNKGKIKIIESRLLGKNRYLFLVEIEETMMLLSSDESGIKVLKEWKKEDS